MGIDAGATKTEAIAISSEWSLIGMGRSGGSNPASVGLEVFCSNVAEAVIASLGRGFSGRIAVIGIGLAGYLGGAWDREAAICIGEKLGVEIGRIEVFEDLDAAHYSAFMGGDGVVAILGTGSSFLGIAGGRRKRVGGWGHLLDDAGGAWSIGLHALQAVVRSLDGRGRDTVLVEKAFKRFGSRDLVDLVRAIYRSSDVKGIVAAFSQDVFQAAREGDEEAARILRLEAEEVAVAYRAIAKDLGILPLAIVGSTYHKNEDIWRSMIEEAIRRITGHRIEIRDPLLSQACSSLLLALGRSGVDLLREKRVPVECMFKE